MKKAFCRLMALPLIAAVGLSFAGCNGTKGSIFSRPTVGKVAGEKKEWIDVDSFTCYYGSLSGNAEETPVMGGETVTAMEALKQFDVAIIHSTSLFTDENAKSLVAELQANGTYVIAYITIGEDDSLHTGDGLGENGYASYYIYENGAPKVNGSWGSYFVDAGNPVWQKSVLAKAETIMDYGVDGLFLDTLDTVSVVPSTMGGMVDLVKKLDQTFPEAKLIANRGFNVYPYVSQYVDGIMFESFSTTYSESLKYFIDRNADEMEYNYSIASNIINRARRYDYMPVFCLEYVNAQEYSYMPQGVYNAAWQFDFIPYATYSRQLDVCPNPGIKPTVPRGELALKYMVDTDVNVTTNGDTSENNLAYEGNGLCTVTVDSTFVGYSGAKPLNDGFYATAENHNQNNWATEAWASENNPAKDHWIQFAFDTEQSISKVVVYWGADGMGTPTIYSAREAYVEAYIDGEWKKIEGATYSWKNGSEYLVQQQSTTFEFAAVKTDRIRVVQPKNMGDATSSRTDGATTTFSGIMWVSEVEIYR
ncbi:MAG: hypothetical protein HFE26_00775 [Clostridia bacterium]|nr:hypothetical protein [Clostridia bacterium]